jgi:photosystem II stability/assembly factor-like uncharacterized protein
MPDQPELGTVVERSRQRGIRRRTLLGAAGAALVVAAAIPLLRTTSQPVSDRPVAPPAIETTTEQQTTTPSALPPPSGPFMYDLDFADAMHGFGLRATCADERAADCTVDLLVTEDRGDHWESRGLPAEITHPEPDLMNRLYVLGPRSLAVGAVNPPGPNRFYSADAGRHWIRVEPVAQQNTAAIPDGALLDSSCTDAGSGCELTVTAIEPRSGRALNLRSQPPLKNPSVVSNLPVAGGWWVCGADPATGRWLLAVSRDSGRTWSTTGLPSWTGNTWQATMTTRNTTIYVAVTGELTDVKNGLLAIFGSRDGGSTWEQTFGAEDDVEPRSMVNYPMATADGRLVVTTEGGAVYRSMDGGKHFEALPNAGIAAIIAGTRGGYLAATSVGYSNVYKLSSDGVGWKEITIR